MFDNLTDTEIDAALSTLEPSKDHPLFGSYDMDAEMSYKRGEEGNEMGV